MKSVSSVKSVIQIPFLNTILVDIARTADNPDIYDDHDEPAHISGIRFIMIISGSDNETSTRIVVKKRIFEYGIK